MRQRLLEAVTISLILGVLSTAWSTYNEVKELRHDLRDLRKELTDVQKSNEELWAETSEQVQRLDKTDVKPHRRH